MEKERINPTHFIEVWKSHKDAQCHSTCVISIRFLKLFMEGTRSAGSQTIAVFKIKEK